MLPRAKPRRSSSTSGEGCWTSIWERPVLFSDDAARIRELQVRQPDCPGVLNRWWRCTLRMRAVYVGM
jgi:hypothetical protein